MIQMRHPVPGTAIAEETLNGFLFALVGAATAGGPVSPERRIAIRDLFRDILGCTLPDPMLDDTAARFTRGEVSLGAGLAVFRPAIGGFRHVVLQSALLVVTRGPVTDAEEGAIAEIIQALGFSPSEALWAVAELNALRRKVPAGASS